MINLDAIDLTDHELYRNGFPHELFTTLRKTAPVWRHPDTAGTERLGVSSFWVLSRHAEVWAVGRDAARFRSGEGPQLIDSPVGMEEGRFPLLAMDAPEHTRFRALVSRGFTPRSTERLEAKAHEWARTILTEVLERGQCEFVHEVAYQLPLHMIADIMGIPYADRKWVFDKVDLMLQAMDPQSPMSLEQQATAILETYQYAHALGEEKRRNPTDDVWTTLTAAQVELPDGTRTQLSEEELAIFFVVLTVGGSETTRNAIAGGLMALLDHPDQLKLLRDDPTLVPTAVEEILRWTSPLTYFRRTAVEDVVIGDQRIEAGDRVTMWFPSANRDGDIFEDPFRFDITRAHNPHVAFGAGGPHYCLGANLARRELKAFLEELLNLVGDITITGQPQYSVQGIENPITLGFTNLPVQLSPRSATRLAGQVVT